jgi:hemin uptake protein HemP
MRTSVQELPTIGYDQIPMHDANELTNGGYLANIKLQDQVYTLRITRAGKLILTK